MPIRSLALATLLTGTVLSGSSAAAESWRPAVVYGHTGTTDLVLDLALPAPSAIPAPVVVCIHGGGWIGGSRTQFAGLAKRLAAKGFAAASIDYRLAPGAPMPAQIEDAKCAVRWLRAHADELKLDPRRFAALGESAGGHLALMLGLTDAAAGLDGDGGNPGVDSRVQAVVSLAGPTDMAPEAWDAAGVKSVYHSDVPTVMAVLGGAQAATMAARCSPVHFVDKLDPPVLAFHGDADKVVPLAQAQHLADLLKEAGVEQRLVVMPGLGHGFSGQARGRMEAEAIAFISDHLTKATAAP